MQLPSWRRKEGRSDRHPLERTRGQRFSWLRLGILVRSTPEYRIASRIAESRSGDGFLVRILVLRLLGMRTFGRPVAFLAP